MVIENIGPISSAVFPTVRNVGVTFHQPLSFDKHVGYLAQTYFYHLRNIFYLNPLKSSVSYLIYEFLRLQCDEIN